MTEEEKIAYLQHKALQEEQERQQAAQVAMQFLKDKLLKEEQAVKLNETKLITKWRAILRQNKSEELRTEIQILAQTFERIVDRKSNVIEVLVHDLEQAESQHRLASRSHDKNLEDVITMHGMRIHHLQKMYDDDIKFLKTQFGEEKTDIEAGHKKEVEELQTILFAMEQTFQERADLAKQEYHSMQDEIKNRENEDKTALRIHLEQCMDSIYKQFEAALKQYQNDTQERRQDFEMLKEKDDNSSKIIDTQMKKIQRIQQSISDLKDKMQNNAKDAEFQNKTLRQEYEQMQTQYRLIKQKMNSQRERWRDRLTQVTLLSNDAIKKLTNVKEKAERIMRHAEMCRSLMTEEEKVLPFYSTSLTNDELGEAQNQIMEEKSNLAEISMDYEPMENFWKRYNKVLLDKLALKKEEATLESENAHLRAILKQYLDGISVNEETLAQRNPLFVVNEKTNVNLSNMDSKNACKTVVEAAHIVKNIL